ncbi:MAG: hypothetical protein NT007_16795 [Candidatus Kapabacteria bacterium]|nr:hypothetical protein [Candidatus Kapabacteria bacterium]
MSEDFDRQEPERPAKKSSGGMGLTKILIIIFVVILLQGGLFFILFKFVLNPSGPTDPLEKEKSEQVKRLEEEKKKLNGKENEEEAAMAPEKELHYGKTGRITTNPKGSDRFVVINLGIEFRSKEPLEGGTKENPFSEKMFGRIQSVVNGVLGSMSIDELQSKRDSLHFVFKDKLKPVIQAQKECFLRGVDVIEFILQ